MGPFRFTRFRVGAIMVGGFRGSGTGGLLNSGKCWTACIQNSYKAQRPYAVGLQVRLWLRV